MKQPARCRGTHQVQHRCPASRLPHQRHRIRVATERGNVLMHPAKRQHLVVDRRVGDAIPSHRAHVQVTENAEPEIDRDVHHVRRQAQEVPLQHLFVRRTSDERSTVEVHHHWQNVVGVGAHNVESEAVFGADHAIFEAESGLHRRRCEHGRVTHALPLRRRPRGAKTLGAGGGITERHTPPRARPRRRVDNAAYHT